MNYLYNNNQNTNPRNRQERRKNGERGPKKPVSISDLTYDQIEKIVRTELQNLISQPYSEVVKKERYKRLEPLVEEYKRQKQIREQEKNVQNTSVKPQKEVNEKNIPDSVKRYNAQKSQVQNLPIYRQLNYSTNVRYVDNSGKNIRTRKSNISISNSNELFKIK